MDKISFHEKIVKFLFTEAACICYDKGGTGKYAVFSLFM